MRVAPASMALSTNSLTEEDRSVIACPATRRLMELEEMGLMSGASSDSSCSALSFWWAAALAAVLSSCVIVGGSIMAFMAKAC